jgi:hypothetical protein
MPQNEVLLPTSDVCRRYNVCQRTISRWEEDDELNFPIPAVIRKRRYWRQSELDAFDRAQVTRRAA